MRKYSVIIPLGVSGLFHVNVTVVIVEVEAKLCGALYGPGEREKEEGRGEEEVGGGGEGMSINQTFQKQSNKILRTKILLIKILTHANLMTTCTYTLTTYYLVLSQIYTG